MRSWPDAILIVAVALAILLAAAGLTTCGVWTWQDSQDKRACRRNGGTVVLMERQEWHCVGATPEAR